MFERQMNPRKQGDIGMGIAIGWFACNGYTVCVPLTDSQRFDLVVATPNGLLSRVQVKTTTVRDKYNRFQVGLRTKGGNRSGTGRITFFDSTECDLLFIVTSDGDKFLIPSRQIRAKSGLSLGDRCKEFLVI